MLTSPVNVVIPANGVALKANSATSDHNARREPPLPPLLQPQPPEGMIEPELPSSSPLTNVNAVTATVGSRTVLQELALNLATILRIARRADENLTSLFLRIIATIEAMPQAERLQVEVRAGLKPLKITLADLATALRKPDGQAAARLTALAEAPAALPGRTAANAATTTYLEEGTDSGHTEETLAMRAAARHSAAGQNLFAAESKMRPAEFQHADGKVLQSHLQAMFESGASTQAAGRDEVDAGDEVKEWPAPDSQERATDTKIKADPRATDAGVRPPMPAPSGNAGEKVMFSSANFNLDPPSVERIRSVAQAIANLAESIRADQQHPAPEKAEDRRVQTMLTLKGLAEVVTAIPAKAAELLAAVVAEAAAPLPETAAAPDRVVPGRVVAETQLHSLDGEPVPEFVATSNGATVDDAAAPATADETIAGAMSEDAAPVEERAEAPVTNSMADERQAVADADGLPLPRSDLSQHAVPFAYAQAQPAREEIIAAVDEEDAREDAEEDGTDEGEDDEEPRRPRDEYDAIHDPAPEEDPAIVINRDSTEADRVFALYQRMGGF